MENPAELIRKARRNARVKVEPERADAPRRQAAPHPATAPERPDAPLPRPVSRHATYTNLMRKHDRVRTQHLGGQRRAGGA